MPAPGFFNENENRAYPFTTGASNPPEALVVDAGFVAGPRSRFDSEVPHSVRLAGVRRAGAYFYLFFTSDAPELYGVTLTFVRHVGDDDFSAESTDSGTAGQSASSASFGRSVSASDSAANRVCDEPLWSGFVVTGRMAAFAALLPGDGEVAYAATVEPALVQNLSEAYVTQFAVANTDRTRVAASVECGGDAEAATDDEVIHTNSTCVLGDVVFVAGYNCTVRQNREDNSITLVAVVGGGAGEPCEPVKTYALEKRPDGSDLLEGGPTCNQTLRSVNGLGGPILNVIAGSGVTVTSVPEENKIQINLNMTGLAMCFDGSARSESC